MTARTARAAAVLTLAAALLGGCVGMPTQTIGAGTCDPPAPAGVSTAAQAYAAATHEALEHRRALSDTITEQGGWFAEDLRTAASIDQAFLDDVRAIRFSDVERPVAEAFIRAVEADSSFLMTAAAEDGYYAANSAHRMEIKNARNAASLDLRTVLGLPSSSCALNLP